MFKRFIIAEYPWLNHPLQLESSNFQSLKLKLNFSSVNKNGSNKINSVYYQIIFKVIITILIISL